MEQGTPVRYRDPNGSWGMVEGENHFGGYRVRWNYGKDVNGKAITSLDNVRLERLRPIDPELYARYINCRAWTPEQKLIEQEELCRPVKKC